MKDYERCEMSSVLIITNVHSLLIVDHEKLICMDILNHCTVSQYDYVFTKTVTIKEKYLCVFSDKKVILPSRNLKLFL